MPPKQATLGKFFGKSDGSVAKQQSKLSFSTKPKPEKRDSAPKEEPKSSPEEVKTQDNVKEESDAEVKEEVKGETMEVDDPVADGGKKRQAKEEEEDSEDEPPTKRQRRKPAKEAVEPKKSKAVLKKADKEAEEPKKPKASPKKAAKSPAKSKKPVVKPKVVEPKDEDEEVAAPKKIAESKKDVEKSPVEEDADSSPKDEEVLSSDEEPEELKQKARKKVQTTLTSTTKDLYPDWKSGEPVPYAALCTTFSKIEMTTKRLEISAHCSLFLRQVLRLTPTDLLPTVLLMINKLAADYAGIELGIGESLIMKAISESTGRTLAHIKTDQNEIGDLGLVAAKSRSKQPTMFKPKSLTVQGVHKGLLTIATIEGQGSQGRKVDAIKKLLSAADAQTAGKQIDIEKDKGGPSEAKYIVRTLEGKLRLGLAERTVVVALSQAMIFHEMSQESKIPSTADLAKAESTLKSVYSELPSYEVIVPAMLEHGLSNLPERCRLQPGVPLKPMLAKPTKSITEVLDRFEGKDFTCEYKYDGERAQIHFVAHDAAMEMATAAPAVGKSDRGVSNIFSRNSEDLSKKYPDILAKLPTWIKQGTSSFVLDCETVAWDMVEKKVLPFQQLMTRKRKDVKVEDVKVQVCVFAFDILYLNGEALVNKSFRERREALLGAFDPVEGEFAFAKFGNTNELEEIQILLEDSVKASCEGLMVKMLDGPESSYEPSKRSQNWLKVKKDYLAGVGDSLDLVVLGAYFGRGKRTSWYGAFLLACYNPKTQNYETVCNIGTGFSEAILETLHKQLSEIVIDRPKPFYTHSSGNKDQPDVWFEPRYVWEVKTADLTLSPRYRAAADEVSGGGKGISLRFPRFIKERDDKKPDEASTSRMIAEMYQRQESVSKTKGPSADDDFEY
ncbi:ATP-dependent DNA ligase [Dothidotthia symphoricarpi CBS 119687]|uniref:DNA ligase n=1 Tax=Dothidotthia symphoricarpi CBS 119687 TaxID=1392245 RepID=A0A6A6AIP8_9PLEO|nr:ATP-dependent DNA ligase [Dothidotthia symphoricarpi CBS 119687]KAF2131680.1 ATP-dependent DNA ligase [Dothidotthia symphoricarpi CBS 119687]